MQEDRPAPEETAGEKKKVWWPGWALVAAAIMGVFALASLADDGGDSDNEPTSDKAIVMCEEFVRDSLKAPATAEFGSTSTSSVYYNTWEVVGQVDSENGFGAMLRNTYVCTVSAKDDVWTLKGLRFVN